MITAIDVTEPKYIDPSSLSTFSRCPAKYYFSRILGLQQREAPMIAPDFGTCIHLALPLCYDIGTLEEAKKVFDNAWDGYGYGESDPKRNKKRAHATLENFARSRANDRAPYEVMRFPRIAPPTDCKLVSDNELPFLIDIGGPLPLAGRIDLVLKWRVDSRIYPCDYKTASEVSDRLFESFWNAPQTLAYTFACGHLIGELPPGLMIEAIRVSPKNDEVSLFPVHALPHLIERFINWANATAASIMMYTRSKRWPTKPSGCSSYAMYGSAGFTCPYKNLCNSPDWQAIMPLYERKEPFHPFVME